jgi:5-carboxyvanillate decarboxylase
MKKIGLEEHFNTKAYLDYLASRKVFPKLEMVEEEGRNVDRIWWSSDEYLLMEIGMQDRTLDLAEGRLKAMDENGIEVQVLSLCAPGVGQFEAAEGTSMAKGTNDELAEIIRQHPKRFAGFAAIAPQDPEAAAAELERAVKKLGFKGVLITGHSRGEFLDGRKYWVIFEMAEKLDVPIYIHPWAPPPDMVKPYLTYKELAMPMWGFAAETGLHAMRLICSGVLDKYPGVKIILGHMGESIPFWLWRLDSRWTLVSKRKMQKTPSQYFKDNFYVTTSGMFWEPALQFVCKVLGPERVLFATDYPYEAIDEAAQFIDSARVSEEDRKKICYLNAEKLLKL